MAKNQKSLRFDMEECLKERKHHDKVFENRNDARLAPAIRISGAPADLSRFRTRVVLNEVINGTPLEKAVERALSITDKRPATK